MPLTTLPMNDKAATSTPEKTTCNFTNLPTELRLPILLDAATQTGMPWLRYFHACCQAAARLYSDREHGKVCQVQQNFGRTLDRFEVHERVAEDMIWVREMLQKMVDEVHGECALAHK